MGKAEKTQIKTNRVELFCRCLQFPTCCMSMSGAGGVVSMGSTFGFLGGGLWGLGRLTAPPGATAEPNRDISRTTTASNRHHAAAAILWMMRDWDWNVVSPYSRLSRSTPVGSTSPVCTQLLLVCFIQSPIWAAAVAQKERIHETNSWDIGWLAMFNINWVYWQNEVTPPPLQCSVHSWTTEGSLA